MPAARSSSNASPSTGGGAGHLDLGGVLQLTGRAGRRGLDEEGHAVALWSSETRFSDAARVASAPPPDLRAPRSGPRTTWRSIWPRASIGRRPTTSCAAPSPQWQAQRADLLTIQVTHAPRGRARAVGYLKGWALSATVIASPDLPRVDLLIAEALAAGLLTGAEPAVLAGVVSAVVFEPRRGAAFGRSRRVGPGPRRSAAGAAQGSVG